MARTTRRSTRSARRNNPNYIAAKVSAGRWFTPGRDASRRPPTTPSRTPSTQHRTARLVIVYPNKPSADPRQNPRGAYYENLIISKRVKLQGVGPGSPDGIRPWLDHRRRRVRRRRAGRDRLVRATRCLDVGRQPERLRRGRHLALPAEQRRKRIPDPYSATTAPTIDGFDLRGGDQMGFPGNLSEITGLPNGRGRRSDDPGRRDLRQRLRPQPADHEQRGPEQRRRVLDDPDRHARSGQPRTTRTMPSGS